MSGAVEVAILIVYLAMLAVAVKSANTSKIVSSLGTDFNGSLQVAVARVTPMPGPTSLLDGYAPACPPPPTGGGKSPPAPTARPSSAPASPSAPPR